MTIWGFLLVLLVILIMAVCLFFRLIYGIIGIIAMGCFCLAIICCIISFFSRDNKDAYRIVAGVLACFSIVITVIYVVFCLRSGVEIDFLKFFLGKDIAWAIRHAN